MESQESRQAFAVIKILDRVKMIINVKVSYTISATHRVFEKSGLRETIVLGFGRFSMLVRKSNTPPVSIYVRGTVVWFVSGRCGIVVSQGNSSAGISLFLLFFPSEFRLLPRV